MKAPPQEQSNQITLEIQQLERPIWDRSIHCGSYISWPYREDGECTFQRVPKAPKLPHIHAICLEVKTGSVPSCAIMSSDTGARFIPFSNKYFGMAFNNFMNRFPFLMEEWRKRSCPKIHLTAEWTHLQLSSNLQLLHCIKRHAKKTTMGNNILHTCTLFWVCIICKSFGCA